MEAGATVPECRGVALLPPGLLSPAVLSPDFPPDGLSAEVVRVQSRCLVFPGLDELLRRDRSHARVPIWSKLLPPPEWNRSELHPYRTRERASIWKVSL